MSFLASQRLAWWQLALVALVLGAGSCGNDTPDDGRPVATKTTVAFSAPAHLGVNDVRESGGPRIAVGQGATWVTVWGTTPTGILAQRSTDGGAHWSAPIVVDASQQGFAPDLACDRHGVCVATWKAVSSVDGENDVYAARSADDGATWGAPVVLSRPGVLEAFNSDAQIAADGNGEWVVVWDAIDVASAGGFQGRIRVEAVTSHDGAVTWGAITSLAATDAGDFYLPRIAADGTGHWVVIFNGVEGDFSGFESHLFAVRSSDGRTWSEPVAVGARDPDSSSKDGTGDVGTDGAGTWHVVWTAQRPDEKAGGTFQEILVARSVDGGATWSVPQQLDTPGASTVDILARLAADDDGHVVVIWLTYLEANRLMLLSAQSSDAGVTWGAAGDFPGGAANPLLDGLPDVALATDRDGAWAATWSLAVPGAHSIQEPHDIVVASGATRPED